MEPKRDFRTLTIFTHLKMRSECGQMSSRCVGPYGEQRSEDKNCRPLSLLLFEMRQRLTLTLLV